MVRPWLAWQLLDSAFPVGSFGHSGGVEAAWQAGEIAGPDGFEGFLRQSLWQAGHAALPFVTAACAAPTAVERIDARCHAALSNHVSNRASLAQGQALVVAAEKVFGVAEVIELRARLRAGRPRGHLAPMFGAVTGFLAMDQRSSAHMFLFTTLRGLVSAGVRLGIVGPLEGQRIQHGLSEEAENIAERCAAIPLDDVCQTSPLIDLFQGTQDRLYSRLFQS